MFGLPDGLGRSDAQPLTLLCLGAHADDVEIGAGGTVRRLLQERPHTDVVWVVLSASDVREAEARASAAEALAGARFARIEVESFRDGRFPLDGERLKAYFADTLQPVAPDLVLTHRLDDAHQDHRAVAEATWQTFRGGRIAAYEIPKWDGDLSRPNAYVTLDAATARAKTDGLLAHFASQIEKPWFDALTFDGLMRVRGVEAGAGFAEAFHCAKVVW